MRLQFCLDSHIGRKYLNFHYLFPKWINKKNCFCTLNYKFQLHVDNRNKSLTFTGVIMLVYNFRGYNFPRWFLINIPLFINTDLFLPYFLNLNINLPLVNSHPLVQVECRGKGEDALPKLVPRCWTAGGVALP